MEQNGVLKVILNQLSNDKNKNEILLEELLNSPLTATLHIECIKVLKDITSINETVETLKNYIE